MPCSAEPERRRGRRLWLALTLGALLLPSLAVWAGGALAAQLLDGRPGLIGAEPWRLWSAAWVHWSRLHLSANALGTLLLLWLGWQAGVPRRAAVAWVLAWPLVQLGVLLLQPGLGRYGGLSGVLHAGVAVVVVWLLRAGRAHERRVGLALLAGLLLKLLDERFWLLELRRGGGWDISVVPLAHALGAAAGLLLAALLLRPVSPLPRR